MKIYISLSTQSGKFWKNPLVSGMKNRGAGVMNRLVNRIH
jgi:hypothetical protein